MENGKNKKGTELDDMLDAEDEQLGLSVEEALLLNEERYEVGRDVLSMCTKCKMELGHVIIAMIDDQPKKVKCNTCGSEHIYRPTTPAKAKKTTAKKKAVKLTAEAAEDKAQKTAALLKAMWESEVLPNKDKAVAYEFQNIYQKGDIVIHGKFGHGKVVEVPTTKEIRVLFPDGIKRLVQNREGLRTVENP